jgi:CCR4-NOT transcription complex subunit 2
VEGRVAGGVGSDFSIQNKDFPALSMGTSTVDGSGLYLDMALGAAAAAAAEGRPGASTFTGPSGLGGGIGGCQDAEQLLRQQQEGITAAAIAGSALRGGGATAVSTSSGALRNKVRAASGDKVSDRFGLLSLMPSLKMTDPDLTMLTLGPDLTSLGLNLNASECLHRTFASPLSDNTVKTEPNFILPACYRHTPQRLMPGHLGKFKVNIGAHVKADEV